MNLHGENGLTDHTERSMGNGLENLWVADSALSRLVKSAFVLYDHLRTKVDYIIAVIMLFAKCYSEE